MFIAFFYETDYFHVMLQQIYKLFTYEHTIVGYFLKADWLTMYTYLQFELVPVQKQVTMICQKGKKIKRNETQIYIEDKVKFEPKLKHSSKENEKGENIKVLQIQRMLTKKAVIENRNKVRQSVTKSLNLNQVRRK